jgi:hypothetical protein
MLGVQRGAVLTMVGLRALFIQDVQRSTVLIMAGLQVLFMSAVHGEIFQIMAELQARFMNDTAGVYVIRLWNTFIFVRFTLNYSSKGLTLFLNLFQQSVTGEAVEVTNNIQTFLKSVYHEAAKITCRIKQLEYF